MNTSRQAALKRSTSNVPSVAAELHQVDAGQVAGRVVEEHVLGAGVRGVDPPRVRAGVPAVDRRVVLHARIAAGPGRLAHAVEHLAGRIARAGLLGLGHPVRRPRLVGHDGLHELVAQADREIRVLEEDRIIGLGRLVAAFLDQRAGLLLLAVLALDELHDVRDASP